MKLLHVIAEMDPAMGGVCQAVRTLVLGLEKLGVHNEVVSLDAPDAEFLVNDTFTTHALGPGKGPWFYNAQLLPWLKENLAHFDVVVVHGLWLYHSYAVNKALDYLQSKIQNTPALTSVLPKLFVMPHGMLDPYFQRAAGRKMKAIRNWFYWKLIENKLINNATLLFTCEEELLLAKEPFKPYYPKNTVVVGLGVAQPPLYTDKMREAFLAVCPELKTQPYLLFLSRINEKKGVDLLLKSYASVTADEFSNSVNSTSIIESESISEDDSWPQLIVAGPGLNSDYGQTQKQLVAKSPQLQKQVAFPGMLTGDAKWGAFYGCEAFVLPSHQENFGIAVVEALACGKPVLISNQVNIWREIADAKSGLVADDTLEGTNELLLGWKRLSEEEKQSMRMQACNIFSSKFSIDSSSEKFLSAIAN
ncbi:glycosyltransferase [Hymenobacter sp. HMF4947]|uniref:Glycosyltransferase n=2 Tax=Hymenobacter ginkgonis TaxID=2682976 RepID=A0A7K1TFS1_9BACT|nr:glycosyltransferase [Hymenobacter ginkgonis]